MEPSTDLQISVEIDTLEIDCEQCTNHHIHPPAPPTTVDSGLQSYSQILNARYLFLFFVKRFQKNFVNDHMNISYKLGHCRAPNLPSYTLLHEEPLTGEVTQFCFPNILNYS